MVPNGRHLECELKRLRRAQRKTSRRRGPDRGRGHPHPYAGGEPGDSIHQLTTRLVRGFDTIVIEDLHVAGMLRNKRLARHISGANWAEIRRRLTYRSYKTEWAGKTLIVADRWFASR